jgi:predicted NBD/HSP70 family sugar kinase
MLMNLKGDVLDKRRDTLSLRTPFATIIDLVVRLVFSVINDYALDKKRILGVGIALPGMVDDEHNILLNAPNLKIKNYTFDTLQHRLGLPVFIENEANIAAFAEHALGLSKDIDNLVYVSITDGVGCGIIISQHIYKGNTNRAGEFGHIRVSDREMQCNCGRFGCWELFASNLALLRYFSDETGLTDQTIDDLFAAFKQGQPSAKKALETYVMYLTRGIENVLLALNPDCIVIGGQIAKYGDIMQKYLTTIDNIPVRFSSLADDASLIGAAMIPLQEILSFSTITL